MTQLNLISIVTSRLILTTDRKSVSEGEYIEIRWACDACPDSLYLAIDSGSTQYSIAVSDSGVTRIPIPRSNGKMTVKLIGVISGKKVTESIDVRVKATKKARTKAPLSSRMKMFREKMQAKWYVFRAGILLRASPVPYTPLHLVPFGRYMQLLPNNLIYKF